VSPKLEQDAAKEAAKAPPPAHAPAHHHLAHARAQSPKTPSSQAPQAPTVQAQSPTSTPKDVLYKEANKRFWNRTHYKPGQKLDLSIAEDRRQAQVWMEILHEIEREANAGHLQLTPEVPLPVPLPPPPMQPSMYPGRPLQMQPGMQRPLGMQMPPGMHGRYGHGQPGMHPGMQPGGQPGMESVVGPPGGPGPGGGLGPEMPSPRGGLGPEMPTSGNLTDMQPSGEGSPTITTDAAPPEGMSTKAKIALGIVGLAVLGGVGYVWYRKSQSPGGLARSASFAPSSSAASSLAPSRPLARGRAPRGVAGRGASHSALALPAERSGTD
jgi:hypothetical protein